MKLQAIQCAQKTQTALMDHPLVYLTRKGEEYVYYFDLGESLYKLIFRTVILFVNASLLDLDHDANVALLCSMSNEV